jgi:Dolichyl-phosphate-mannose-protein mannosyltransferase
VVAAPIGPGAPSSRWVLWISLVAVIGVFAARLPGIVEPLGPDQGLYAAIGWGLSRGLSLYRDMFEQKPPGIYVTYWLGFTLFGTRTASIFWLDYLAGALTALILFDLGRRVVSLRFGALAAGVFAIGTMPAARHAYGGFLERTISETFICLLAAAGAWATAMTIARARDGWSIVAGLMVGLALVFKPTAFVYLPALALWTWLVTDAARARRFALWSVLGSVVAPIVALLWMWASGVLHDAWIALAEYNTAYLAVGGRGLAPILNQFAHEVWRRMKTDEVWALGTLSAVVAVSAWRWRRTRSGSAASLGVVWLGAALVAIVLNGPRMFQTYFVPSLVPLCFLFAWLLDQVLASRHRSRTIAAVLLLGLLGVMLVRSGSVARAVSVTSWDARHLFGYTDRQAYLARFQSQASRAFSAADNERLADYVRAHTQPDDRIFVFGMSAGTYYLSGRLPASRFLFVYPAVSNMIDRPDFRVETLASELARTAPRYIVLQRHNGDTFSGWRAQDAFDAPPMVALLRGYHQETEVGDFVVYRRDSRLAMDARGSVSLWVSQGSGHRS